MATTATNQKPNASPKRRHAPRPKHWWEGIFVYPALLAALITAGPQWVDRISAWTQNVASGSLKEAQQQTRMWHANFDCSQLPAAWYTGAGNVKIDATTCNSGDVFIRAMNADTKQSFLWVPLDEVLKAGGGSGGGLVGTAHAATLASRAPLLAAAYQSGGDVLCQKFIDDRHILRRVKTPQGCFDEVIDTFNGQVVSRKEAPCTPQCG
ncbi:MAG TPA: hypothetical protein VFH89_07150 [Sphingomicrobium sp.]|nr:hypothetical protein [Sphingomicrobium sp.]